MDTEEKKDIVSHDFPVWREKANFIIAFPLEDEDVPPGIRWEQIWARQIEEDLFEVCCVPFFVYDLALGDLVQTSPKNERKYAIDKIVKSNEHLTYRVWFLDLNQWDFVVERIGELKCAVEKRWDKSKLIGIDAPTSEMAVRLETYLSELEANQIINYETGLRTRLNF